MVLSPGYRRDRFQAFVVSRRRRLSIEAGLRSWADRLGLPIDVVALQPGEGVTGGDLDWSDGAIGVIVDVDEVLGRGRHVDATPGSPDASLVLPNGLAIAEHRRGETTALVAEIFQRRSYLRHGLRIEGGDIVIDIGANIGLFAAFCHLEADDVVVHALEPAAPIASVLRDNAERLPGRTVVHDGAIDGQDGTATFSFYEGCSLLSGLRADPEKDTATARDYATRQGRRAAIDADGLAEAYPATMRRSTSTISVETLETFLRRNAIESVGLLKIDAEGCEHDILACVGHGTWEQIRQVVVEVHDGRRAAEKAVRLLDAAGFLAHLGQDEAFEGSETWMVWARRPGPVALNDDDMRRVAVSVDAAAELARTTGLSTTVVALCGAPIDHDDLAAAAVAELAERCAARDLAWLDLTGLAAAEASASPDAAIAAELTRRLTASARPPTKVVVVDADNTLWDGVCGEDRQLGAGPPWVDLQRVLLAQRMAGRALVLCSHNDLRDVEDGFRRLPQMPLSLADFDDIAVGWEPKSVLIAAVLQRLGAATETCVVIDDDPALREQIRSGLPGASVVELPADPQDRLAALEHTWQLDLGDVGEADRARGRLRRQERRRAGARETASTRRQWLNRLNLQVTISAPTADDTARLADLSQRTNQFNLTLRRHGPAGVEALLALSWGAWAIRVTDAFGDYGLVGLIAARRRGDTLDVTDWTLSCRVLGRNVEWAVLAAVATSAAAGRMRDVRVTAVAGPRNTAARAFVEQLALLGQRNGDGAIAEVRRIAELDWRDVDPSAGVTPTPIVGDARWPTVRWPAPDPPAAQIAAHMPVGRRRPHVSPPSSPAQTPLQRDISVRFGDVLGFDVGIDDDLRALGGDSIAALRICESVGESQGVRPSLSAFLRRPTVRALAELLEHDERRASILPDTTGARPVTAGRRRLWAAQQTTGRRTDAIVPVCIELDPRVAVDAPRLSAALHAVKEVHPALGETVRDGPDGLYVGHSAAPIPIDELDAETTVGEVVAGLAAQVDLIEGPLLAAAIVPRPTGTLIVIAIHHACFDGASIPPFLADLDRAYRHGRLDAAVDFGYAHHAHRSACQPAAAEAIAAQFHRHPTAGPAAEPGPDRAYRLVLDADLVAQVGVAARRLALTPAVIELAALAAAWSATIGQPAARLAFMHDNRDEVRPPDAVGFFANVVPLDIDVPLNGPVDRYLSDVGAAFADALARAAIPYGHLLEAVHGNPFVFAPPFDVLLTRNPPAPRPSFAGRDARYVWTLPDRAAFAVMLDVQPGEDGTAVALRVGRGALSETQARLLLDNWTLLLGQLSTPDGRLADRPPAATAPSAGQVRNLRERLLDELRPA